MEEDRASRSRVSIVCGRAEREEQGGEYRRMAEQARGRIRGVYEGEKDRRTIPYTYGTFVLFAHCRTRVYRIQRHTPPCDLLRNATPLVKPSDDFRKSVSFESPFFPFVSK